MTRRLAAMGQEKYDGLINQGKSHFNGVVRTYDEALAKPLKRRRGTLYFVNSMADLFHREVSFEFAAAVFGVMGEAERHQFQVLTKRPERAAEFFEWVGEDQEAANRVRAEAEARLGRDLAHRPAWPLPNVWIGTSVEDGRVMDRVDAIKAIPAKVRFLSCEPLIGPINLHGQLDGIHWVIVGGESGHGARPMQLEWASSIQEACSDASVPYFFKQAGRVLAQQCGLGPSKGSDADEWPEELAAVGTREFPVTGPISP
jgi:protein gp37